MQTLKQFSPKIWIYDGESVQWYGMPYTTRMTVIELPDNKLWIHSPSKISDFMLADLSVLGDPHYLVSPNKLHHLYLKEWKSQFPQCRLYAPPGLVKKRKDIIFDHELEDLPEAGWAGEIDQLIFRGSPIMEEVVFFHKPSGTLILTDLVENFPENQFSGIKSMIARMAGIVSPDGKTPLDWRLSFLMGNSKARDSFSRLLAWNPEKIVIAHGECIEQNAIQFLKKSFRWLI